MTGRCLISTLFVGQLDWAGCWAGGSLTATIHRVRRVDGRGRDACRLPHNSRFLHLSTAKQLPEPPRLLPRQPCPLATSRLSTCAAGCRAARLPARAAHAPRWLRVHGKSRQGSTRERHRSSSCSSLLEEERDAVLWSVCNRSGRNAHALLTCYV